MTDPLKTVFICYRDEKTEELARMLYLALRRHKFAVYAAEGCGTVDPNEWVVFDQIAARGHFILLIDEGTFEGCSRPDDDLRSMVEYAIETGRNIVPVLVNGYELADGQAHLTGVLSALNNTGALSFFSGSLEVAVDELTQYYLLQPVNGEIAPMPSLAGVDESLPWQRHNRPVASASRQFHQRARERGETDVQGMLEDLTMAIQYDPKFTDAFYDRGNLFAAIGNFDGAIADLTEALFLQPLLTYALLNRGNVYTDMQNYDAALADYTEAIRIDPNDASGYYNRGTLYSDLGDYDAALKDLNKAVSLDPNFAAAFNARGLVYIEFGDYDVALTDFDEAIAIDQDYAEAYNNRGSAFDDLGEFEDAIEDYNEAIRLDPEYVEAYNNRGVSCTNVDEFEAAIEDFTEAARLNPQDVDAYYNRGEAYLIQGQFEPALADFSHAQTLDANDTMVRAGLAITQRALGNLDEAKSLWQGLLQVDSRFNNPGWVEDEFGWDESLVKKARKLIDKL